MYLLARANSSLHYPLIRSSSVQRVEFLDIPIVLSLSLIYRNVSQTGPCRFPEAVRLRSCVQCPHSRCYHKVLVPSCLYKGPKWGLPIVLHGDGKTPSPESASELYRPSDRRLLAKSVPTFADRGCYVLSVTDPNGRILGFLNRGGDGKGLISRYIVFD
jgi:hypothetical protein